MSFRDEYYYRVYWRRKFGYIDNNIPFILDQLSCRVRLMWLLNNDPWPLNAKMSSRWMVFSRGNIFRFNLVNQITSDSFCFSADSLWFSPILCLLTLGSWPHLGVWGSLGGLDTIRKMDDSKEATLLQSPRHRVCNISRWLALQKPCV